MRAPCRGRWLSRDVEAARGDDALDGSADVTRIAVPQITGILAGAALVATVDHRLVLAAMALLLLGGATPLLARRPVAVG